MARTHTAPVAAGGGTGRGGQHDAAAIPLDTTTSRLLEDFQPEPTPGPDSPWRAQVQQLIDAINAGEAEVGRYYLIGKFNSLYGAKTRFSKFVKHRSEQVPLLEQYVVDFRVEQHSAQNKSELWAALVQKDANR